MLTGIQSLTLEDFLQLTETKPASEFLLGEVIQKPMPQGEHSVLQGHLGETINKAAKPIKFAYAFPELRCVFGGAVIVPDVAVLRWGNIPRTESGRVGNRFEVAPDWVIEILSPDQGQTKVLEKLLHCMEHGCELGWLIDPAEETVLVILPDRRVNVLRADSVLPVLGGLDLSLTVQELFRWLEL